MNKITALVLASMSFMPMGSADSIENEIGECNACDDSATGMSWDDEEFIPPYKKHYIQDVDVVAYQKGDFLVYLFSYPGDVSKQRFHVGQLHANRKGLFFFQKDIRKIEPIPEDDPEIESQNYPGPTIFHDPDEPWIYGIDKSRIPPEIQKRVR